MLFIILTKVEKNVNNKMNKVKQNERHNNMNILNNKNVNKLMYLY